MCVNRKLLNIKFICTQSSNIPKTLFKITPQLQMDIVQFLVAFPVTKYTNFIAVSLVGRE